MTRTEARRVLTTAFLALPKRDRERLAWHEKQKTPICCGKKKADLYLSGDGGG